MQFHHFLLQLRPLQSIKEHVMKSKSLFYLILLTLFVSLSPPMHAQTYSVLHEFTANYFSPWAGVTIRGSALFGTLNNAPNCGTVYQLTHSGSNWLFSTIAAPTNGCNPAGRVVFGPDGHLYGATAGISYGPWGDVFKLTPQSGPCRDVACYWTVDDLHDFGSGTDGRNPGGGDLIWDQQGNMYGTTMGGGTSGLGAVYELTPSGNGYTESVLYSFSGGFDGEDPSSGLVFDNKDNLYGTTAFGGGGAGTIYELTYVPGIGWTEHVLYSFQNGNDGRYPGGGLIFDSAGNLYGTTSDGGSGGAGTVFELSPSGDTWTFKLLYSFSGQSYCGCGPRAALTMDGTGNLYGTTYAIGINELGNVFKLSNTQNGWVYTSLHDFNVTDGMRPVSNVSIDADGTMYGTTTGGGDLNCNGGAGCGVVWMIKP